MKPKSKTSDRPGTSDSNKQLLPKGRNSADLDQSPTHSTAKRPSNVYSHYQHSLNSLNDIIDRVSIQLFHAYSLILTLVSPQDDKESLAELHEYLSYGDVIISPRLQEFSRIGDRRRSSISSIKSERRRSLPTNTSVISIVSDYSITTRPEVTDFQARRRRAAKLTQFFGVDYRELISDVLESIENGLEHERKRGTLNPDEVEVSLQYILSIILVGSDILIGVIRSSQETSNEARRPFLNDVSYVTHLLPSLSYLSHTYSYDATIYDDCQRFVPSCVIYG